MAPAQGGSKHLHVQSMRIVNMAPLFTAVTSAYVIAALTQSVNMSPMRSETMSIKNVNGFTTAVTAEAKADLQFSNGRTESGYVVGVLEPRTRLFWWRYEVGNPRARMTAIERLKNRFRFFQVDEKLVSFVINGGFLDVRESKETVENLQTGMERATASLRADLADIQEGSKRWFVRVDLSNLGTEFLLRKGEAATLEPASVGDVTLTTEGTWNVMIVGPNRDTMLVTLDKAYRMLGFRAK